MCNTYFWPSPFSLPLKLGKNKFTVRLAPPPPEPDSAAGHKMVGHHLEEVGVQALAVVVRPLEGAAHGGGQAFHLDPDALGVDTALVPERKKWIRYHIPQ